MSTNIASVEVRSASLDCVSVIKNLAYSTWFHAYGDILSREQIIFMLKELYNEATLRQLIESNSQQFIVLYRMGIPSAFAAYGATADANLKLHKIYVLPECQGLGLGRVLINYVRNIALDKNCDYLELNVNRENKAVSFYSKLGFTIFKEVDIPIGPFWMNDFIMRLDLK